MLFLLAFPVFLAVVGVHRYLATYAPSSILIRHVRRSQPRWRTVSSLAVLTSALLLVLRAVEVAIVAGAPGWLNLIALVLAWDAIKFAIESALIAFRGIAALFRRNGWDPPARRRLERRPAQGVQPLIQKFARAVQHRQVCE